MMPMDAAALIGSQPKKSCPNIAARPSAPKSAKKMPNCAAPPRGHRADAHEDHDREHARVDAEAEEVVQESAGLDDAALHDGNAALQERYHAVVQHRGRGDAGERAVREESAEADRQQQKRLEALDDGEVEQDEADRDHDELPDAVGHSAEHLDRMALDEASAVVEVSAVPVEVLVPVSVAVGRQRLPLRTRRLVEVARDERGRLLLEERAQAGVGPHVLDLGESRLPGGLLGRNVRFRRLRAERAEGYEKSH